MGNLIDIVPCLFHEEQKPSMAIYDNGDHKEYHCFGCKAHGEVTSHIEEQIGNIEKRHNRNNQISLAGLETFNEIDTLGKEFLKSRQIEYSTALEYGVKQRGDRILLPCYTVEGKQTGVQIRYLAEDAPRKYTTLGLDGHRPPSYSIVPNNPQYVESHSPIFLVESVIDGLSLLGKTGLPSIVMLGTKVCKEIYEYISSLSTFPSLIIYPDKDAWNWAHLLKDRLSSYIDTYVLTTEEKPYEVDKILINNLIAEVGKDA